MDTLITRSLASKLAWAFSILMAFEFATGTLNVGTGAASTNYSITGKTGTWKAVILWTSGRAETTDASGETDIQAGIGVAVSTSSRWALATQSDHSPTTTATDRYHTDAACLAVLDIAGAVVGLLDFVSFNSDGATFVVDDAFPAAVEVSYILLGGSDLTDVATGQFALSTSLGNANYTGLTSFTPDFALFGSIRQQTAPPVAAGNNILSIGMATAAAQYVLACLSSDAEPTSITSSYCRSGEIYAAPSGATAVDDRASFTSFLSDGFQINNLEGTAARRLFFLALKGGSYALGDFLSATDTTAYTEAHGMAVTPKGAMFLSANRAASTQDAATAHYEWSVGASDGSTNSCQYARDKDASGTADCFRAVSHDQCYQNASTVAAQAIEGEGHVNSFDASNINFQMTDADPAQSFIWYAAFGNAPVSFVQVPKPTIAQWAIGRAATW